MKTYDVIVRRCFWHEAELQIQARSPERAEQLALEQLDETALEVTPDFIREFDIAFTLIPPKT